MAQEQHRRSLFAPQGPLYGGAVSRGRPECRALAHLRAADVVDWLEQLLLGCRERCPKNVGDTLWHPLVN